MKHTTSSAHTIFVQRWLADDFATVVDQLLAELLRQAVCLAALRVALVNVVLHVCEEFGIRTVHDLDATRGDLTIDSGEATKDDVVEHEKGILTDPVPGRIEVASLERIETGLDTIDIQIAMLSCNSVETSLKSLRASFLIIELDFSSSRVAFEVSHIDLDLL